MKAILVPVIDRPECKAALERAFSLADSCAGNVIGCHLRPPRGKAAAADQGGRFLGFRKWAPVSQGLNEMEIKAKHEAAETLFTKKAADQGFQLVDKASLGATRTAKWVYMAGSLDTLFSSIGRTADVSVVSRPTKTAKGPGSDFMLAALLETGKPIIVLPKTPAESLGRRVLIAWNQGVEAARAVAAALPLLQQAESVHIVSSGSESRPGAKAAVLVEYLKYWGVKATHNRTKGRDPAVEIMDAFRNQGSDLIVMGAYSRGRVRETVFGGVTEDLLFGSPLPVFALHS